MRDEPTAATSTDPAAREYEKLQPHKQERIVSKLDEIVTDQWRDPSDYLDRARELVNIDTVMADAEFVDTKICRYVRQCGCDYAIRKGATDAVKDTVEGFNGRADWDNTWTLSLTVSDAALTPAAPPRSRRRTRATPPRTRW